MSNDICLGLIGHYWRRKRFKASLFNTRFLQITHFLLKSQNIFSKKNCNCILQLYIFKHTSYIVRIKSKQPDHFTVYDAILIILGAIAWVLAKLKLAKILFSGVQNTVIYCMNLAG